MRQRSSLERSTPGHGPLQQLVIGGAISVLGSRCWRVEACSAAWPCPVGWC